MTTPTTRSLRLRTHAKKLASFFPEAAFPEIFLTGSVGRGDADRYSDIELVLIFAHRSAAREVTRALARAGVKHLSRRLST